MPTLNLTDEQICIILKSLAVCAADAEDSRDNCKGDQIRDYYERKRREYDDTYNAVHDATEDKFFRELDKAIAVSENMLCLNCSEPACSVCADMKH